MDDLNDGISSLVGQSKLIEDRNGRISFIDGEGINESVSCETMISGLVSSTSLMVS